MRLLLFLFAILCAFCGTAQPTENSVVKDSSGTVYPVAIWRALLQQGGYALRAENGTDPNTAYLLVRLTDDQREARLAKLPAPRESVYFKKGEKFNLGKVKDLAGNKIDLKENAGKITVVNFWFINCGPCRREIPDLNTLVGKYASDSVRFVAVALDGAGELEDFLKRLPFNYQVVGDGRYLAQRYGIRSYPTHVVVDKAGNVYFHTTGLSSNTVYWLEKCIKELLATTPAAPAGPAK